MGRRPTTLNGKIFLAAAAAGLILTVALLTFGALGAQIATDFANYFGYLAVLAALYAIYLQRAGTTSSDTSQPQSETTRKSPNKTRRRAHKYQNVALAGIVITILVCRLCVADTPLISVSGLPSSSFDTPAVAGNVTLLQQDGYLKNQNALVFQLTDGKYGYLARSDDRWWLPWQSINLAPSWPGFMDATVFASTYSGLEFLGIEGDGVMFTHRDNALQWYNPSPMLVNGVPLRGVSAGPGFMEYTWVGVKNPQFLALIPRPGGGLGLYERIEKNSFGWTGPVGNGIGSKLGNISAVSATQLSDGSLYVIVRAGSHLYGLTHPRLTYSPNEPPVGFGQGWSTPTEIRAGNGKAVTISGYPQLIATGVSPLGATDLLIAVPVHNGAILLGSTEGNNAWDIERLPINHNVDALTLLSGNVGDRPNIDITYREGGRLLYIWRWENGPWHEPALVEYDAHH